MRPASLANVAASLVPPFGPVAPLSGEIRQSCGSQALCIASRHEKRDEQRWTHIHELIDGSANKTGTEVRNIVSGLLDETPEARELKRPLRRAEQAVKAYYRSKQEKHEVRVNFRKYPCVLTVDKSPVAKMTGGEVIWSDTELEAEIRPHLKEA